MEVIKCKNYLINEFKKTNIMTIKSIIKIELLIEAVEDKILAIISENEDKKDWSEQRKQRYCKKIDDLKQLREDLQFSYEKELNN